MNAAILMLVGAAFFCLAYRLYGRYISKVFDQDDNRPTPSFTMMADSD